MKSIKLSCLLAFTAIASAASVPPSPPEATAASSAIRQSDASFEAAIHNRSTAPFYILITVTDASTGAAQSICTTANFLLGAIHLEDGIGYDPEGVDRAMRVALMSKDHVFTFQKRKALGNIPRYYSDDDLVYVREALQGMSVPQILEAFASQGALHELYQGGSLERHAAYRDAVACVLIERGASPGMGDRTDKIWVRP